MKYIPRGGFRGGFLNAKMLNGIRKDMMRRKTMIRRSGQVLQKQ